MGQDKRLSALEEDILTLLGDREFYGLEILAQINVGRSSPTQFGSLYPALDRLDLKGFLSWRWGDDADGTGGARRKYYRATDAGAQALKQVQEYREKLKKLEGKL
jgi:PadR family transcriptional regulator, regulatory protein PadR